MPRNATRRLMAALDRLTPTLRREVEAALATLRRAVSVERLADAIEGRDDLALRALETRLGRALAPAVATLRRAFVLGATSAVTGVGMQFNAARPLAAQAAAETGAQLVTRVSRQTREAIRAVITDAFREGVAPREVAKQIRPLIGLNARQARAVLARARAKQAAGWTAARIEADRTRYTAALHRARAEMIARTEIIRASTAGRKAAWRQAQQEGHLGADMAEVWIVAPDDRLCPICAPMDGVTTEIGGTFTVDGEVLDGPPAHPNCRCSTGLVAASGRHRRAA